MEHSVDHIATDSMSQKRLQEAIIQISDEISVFNDRITSPDSLSKLDGVDLMISVTYLTDKLLAWIPYKDHYKTLKWYTWYNTFVQVINDYCGFEISKVDGLSWNATRQDVKALQRQAKRISWYEDIVVDWYAWSWYLRAAKAIIQRGLQSKAVQPLGISSKDKKTFLENPETWMIDAFAHNPWAFWSEIWSLDVLPPEYVNKVFFIGTESKRNQNRKPKPKSNLLFHGSAGTGEALVNAAYKTKPYISYTIMENGAICCHCSSSRGIWSIGSNKWNDWSLWWDTNIQGNSYTAEFATPQFSSKSYIKRKWGTVPIYDVYEPSTPQLLAWQQLVKLWREQNPSLRVWTSAIGLMFWSSDHGDTTGRSTNVLNQLSVDQEELDMRKKHLHQSVA